MQAVEIFFRELVRLLRALLSALLSQSWQPLEGALSEMGAGSGLLLLAIGGGLFILLLLIAGLTGFALIYRRQSQSQETVHTAKTRTERTGL